MVGRRRVCGGESRGKIWRVRLVKTPQGYVGREFLIARLSMLTLDLAISPKGDLYVCCHSVCPIGARGNGRKQDFQNFLHRPEGAATGHRVGRCATEVRVAVDKRSTRV